MLQRSLKSILPGMLFFSWFAACASESSQHTSVTAWETELLAEREFPESDTTLISSVRILATANTLFIQESMRGKVYFADKDFNVAGSFDAETCHPGSPFRPLGLLKLNENTILIASNPVQAYLLNHQTMECSSSASNNPKFIAMQSMTSSGNGLLQLYVDRAQNITISEYDAALTQIYSHTFPDTEPYKRTRARDSGGTKIVQNGNDVYLLNTYDHSLMYFRNDALKNGDLAFESLQLSYPDARKTTSADISESAIADVGAAIQQTAKIRNNADIITDIKHWRDSYYLITVVRYDRTNQSYICEISGSAASACHPLPIPSEENIHSLHGDEVITSTIRDQNQEHLVLKRYRIRNK